MDIEARGSVIAKHRHAFLDARNAEPENSAKSNCSISSALGAQAVLLTMGENYFRDFFFFLSAFYLNESSIFGVKIFFLIPQYRFKFSTKIIFE